MKLFLNSQFSIPNSVEWPQPITAFLHSSYGAPIDIERLGGMSGGRVYRVRFGATTVVVKASRSARELRFYRSAAGSLRQHGVNAPALLYWAQSGDTSWMVLEYIPQSLPRERWNADRELLDMLCRLHCATIGKAIALPELFAPAWSEPMTGGALRCFPAHIAVELEAPLRSMQRASEHLFRPYCAISGDPNPANWGLRDGGGLVLFDWERFGLGTPALDLAITVPGLGDNAAFRRVAAVYSDLCEQHGAPYPQTIAELSHDIRLAKLWSVVELMSEHAAGNGAIGQPVIDYLRAQLPAWVAENDPRINTNKS